MKLVSYRAVLLESAFSLCHGPRHVIYLPGFILLLSGRRNRPYFIRAQVWADMIEGWHDLIQPLGCLESNV